MSINHRAGTCAGVFLACHALAAGTALANNAVTSWASLGGSFHDAVNWTNGVPAAGDHAIFEFPVIHATVSFNDDAQNSTFTLKHGIYRFDLNGHTYTLSDVNAPLRVLGTDPYDVSLRDGTMVARKALVAAEDATSELTIESGGSLDLLGDLSLSAVMTVGAGGTLTAAGAEIGSTSSGTDAGELTVEDGGVATFTGAQPVELVAGLLRLSAGQMVTDGDLIVSNGTAQPSLIVSFGSTLDVGGALIVNQPGSGTVCNGTVQSRSGIIRDRFQVEVTGTEWLVDEDLEISGELEIFAGATVNVTGTTSTTFAGFITMSGGTLRTTAIDVFDLRFEDGGRVEVASDMATGGDLDLGSDAVLDVSDALTVRDNIYLHETAAISCGPLEIDDGGNIEAEDAAVISCDSLEIVMGYVDLVASAVMLVGADAVAPSDGGLIVDGPGPATVHVGGDEPDLYVSAGVHIAAGSNGQGEMTVSGDFVNASAQYFEIGASDGSSLHAMLTVAGFANLNVDELVTVHDGAVLQLEDGTVDAETGVDVSGELAGAGYLGHELRNAGLVRPGSPIGLLRIRPVSTGPAEYEQTPGGVLEIELAGFEASQHDQMRIQGNASLGGTLRLVPIEGFEPQDGQGFEIITIVGAGAVIGTFDTVEPAGWDGVYLDDRVIARFTDPCAADLDGTGAVGFNDLALLLGNWGPCDSDCPWDLDGSSHVGFNDLALLLGQWGSCPTGGDQ